VHRRRLLGDQRAVQPVGSEQDGGAERDPLGDRGGSGERDQRLEPRIDEPVHRREAGEASALTAPRELEDLIPPRPGNRARQSDPYVH
jgi:hypothetical protein